MSTLGKFRNEVEDPGLAHDPGGGPISGAQDFSGQDPYDTGGGEGQAGDDTEVPVRITDTSNPKNGSGGSCRTIDPSKVKGINP